MFVRQRRQSSVRKFFSSRIFLVSLFAATALVAAAYARAYYQDYQLKKEIRSLEAEVAALQSRKIESLDLLQFVLSPQYVEQAARTELNMKLPEERVAVVARTGYTSSDYSNPSGDKAQSEPPLSNPTKWWYYITHKSENN